MMGRSNLIAGTRRTLGRWASAGSIGGSASKERARATGARA